LPFLEAARQVRHEIGRDDCFFLHVSLVPYIHPAGEMKTKPTQHSVAALRNIGIQPDAIVLRADRPVPESIKRKIALFCDVDVEAVVAAVDAPSIYDIPRVLHAEGLDAYVVRRLDLPFHDVDWAGWDTVLERVHHPANSVDVAVVGKYIDLPDAYLSISEALRAGGFDQDARVNIRWVAADTCLNPADAEAALRGVDAVVVPGGFGIRGIDGKVGALKWTRENGVPTLGICLGLQSMVIEYARNVLGLSDASSTEFNPGTANPVIATMAEQLGIVAGEGDMGGTMRLGSYDADLLPGSVVSDTYVAHGSGLSEPVTVSERHRHRYEVNRDYREALEAAGMVVSGLSPDGELVEFVELPRSEHPYYVATQAHPEFKSRPTHPHPLFTGLIAAALKEKASAGG
ncbi:MAG: CTP synthase, partial [Promicromonosporaceae bacterium]|nr:CTP synthase [Promicromonosporaceae bacterium]